MLLTIDEAREFLCALVGVVGDILKNRFEADCTCGKNKFHGPQNVSGVLLSYIAVAVHQFVEKYEGRSDFYELLLNALSPELQAQFLEYRYAPRMVGKR